MQINDIRLQLVKERQFFPLLYRVAKDIEQIFQPQTTMQFVKYYRNLLTENKMQLKRLEIGIPNAFSINDLSWLVFSTNLEEFTQQKEEIKAALQADQKAYVAFILLTETHPVNWKRVACFKRNQP